MSRAKVIIEESVVRVVTVGIQGPPGRRYRAGATSTPATRPHGSGPTTPALSRLSTISDFSTAVDARVAIQKGVANGLATLGIRQQDPDLSAAGPGDHGHVPGRFPGRHARSHRRGGRCRRPHGPEQDLHS